MVTLKTRGTIAITIIAAGLVVLISSIVFVIRNSEALEWIGIGVGIVMIIVGIVLLVAELMEGWLTRGQSALVDGLQAG